MRRADTTTVEYQRAFRGRHSTGHGVHSYPSTNGTKVIPGTDYVRCVCGWRLVGVPRTKAGRALAAMYHDEHLDEIKAAAS